MSKHINSGNCDKCLEIFASYPGFHAGLQAWFIDFQKRNPDGHISCAGRGQVAQEEAFKAGTSRAHYSQSSHNYNAAIDVFRLTVQGGASWDKVWFRDKVQSAVVNYNISPLSTFRLNWYGAPGSKFYELPHIEVDNWKELVTLSQLHLVEPISNNTADSSK